VLAYSYPAADRRQFWTCTDERTTSSVGNWTLQTEGGVNLSKPCRTRPRPRLQRLVGEAPKLLDLQDGDLNMAVDFRHP
jgi:hypothetical protein